MADKYAMLDPAGKVRRVSNTKPHETALPVEYPDISDVDRVTHSVRQKPVHEWEVHGDKVVVAYSIKAYDMAEQKSLAKDRLRGQRKQAEASGIEVEGMDIRTDEGSQSRLSGLVATVLADETADNFDFEARPGHWVTLDRDMVLQVSKAVSNHVQAAFTRQRELEAEIDAAEDMHDLRHIDLNAGWPGRTVDDED